MSLTKPISLLFVHSESDDRAMYTEFLRAAGIAVTEVGTTDAAIPLVHECDALVTGLTVPGTADPVEFIGQVRQQHSRLPIVVVTACVGDRRFTAAEAAGADVVLAKPCLPDHLHEALRLAIDANRFHLVAKRDRRVTVRRSAWRGGRRDGDGPRDSVSERIAEMLPKSNSDEELAPIWDSHLTAWRSLKP